ncbi:hypothetical protein [Streptomyces sp. NPDC057412]|uniref:hypothetical protein n=1 Tax=Streptomyces sp. NPDC057412 TaxID=3346123 RepID=UPI003691C641
MTDPTIRFDCRRFEDGGLLQIVPHIDGTPLTELIEFDRAAYDDAMRTLNTALGPGADDRDV